MILDCPACRARFQVADQLIPAAGRVVRCSRCTHEWFVQPEPRDEAFERFITPEAAPEHEAMPIFEDPSPTIAPKRFRATMPAAAPKRVRSARPFKIAAPLIAATWLVVAGIAYFPRWSVSPALSGVYEAFGVTPTDGLAFAEVQMQREQEGNKTRFILSGSIRNNSSALRRVASVRVALKGKDNEKIWGREYPVNVELKAGTAYPFRITNVETTFAKNVASIVVDMGNPLQLMVR